MTTLIGQQLGRYRIQEEIGRGGMARVYRALDTALRRQVALKVLAPQLALDQEFLRRFEREAITAANLRHPGIVTVYDVGEAAGLRYIAMEYVRGRTLHAIIKERGALGLGFAVGVMAPVAAALDYAHAQGAVHRDVKPQNILIDIEGRVLLADFGIAQGPEGPDDKRLTRTGIFMGTPEYISPEQASAQRVDGRSDLYSLGIATYEIITGVVPFSGATPQLIMAHVQTPPPPPSELDPAQPHELDIVLARALAKRPEQRFGSGAAFVAALRIVCRRHAVVPATPAALAALVLPQAATTRVAIPAGVTPPGPQQGEFAPPPARRAPPSSFEPSPTDVTRHGNVRPPLRPPDEPDEAVEYTPRRSATGRTIPQRGRSILPYALAAVAAIALLVAVLATRAIGRAPTSETPGAIIVGTVIPTFSTATPTASPTSLPTSTPLPTNTPEPSPVPATAAPPPATPLPPPPDTPVPPPPDTPVPPTFTPEPPTSTITPTLDVTLTPTDAPYPPPETPGVPPSFTAPVTSTLLTLTPTPPTTSATITPGVTAAPAAAATASATNTAGPLTTIVPPSATPAPPSVTPTPTVPATLAPTALTTSTTPPSATSPPASATPTATP